MSSPHPAPAGTAAPDAERLLGDLRTLSRFGATGQGIRREALTPADVEARQWLASRMRQAGLEVAIDRIGNVLGRDRTARRTVLLGSHLDSVPGGGWLDGAYGVLAGLEVVRCLRSGGGACAVGIDLIAFSDEEGRFGDLTGSRFFCRELQEADLATLRDAEGVSLEQASADAGWSGQPLASLDPDRALAYLEAHIEQGPVLEHEQLQIGVVQAIAGIRRLRIAFCGRADHAGTTPMALRRDAGRAATAFCHRLHGAFAERWQDRGAVWNIGQLRLEPGAFGVVPQRAECSLELRAPQAGLLAAMADEADALAQATARATGTDCALRAVSEVAPAAMADPLTTRLLRTCAELGLRCRTMVSGAGHDAMVLARHLPAGMLFIPSRQGRSHSPLEDSDPEDIVRGAAVLMHAVQGLQQA